MNTAPTEERPVTVVVLTFQRPHLLPEILAELNRQVESARPTDTQSGVLVVDNDPVRSAEGAVAEAAGLRITYVCEPRPGIGAARQRALQETPSSHLLVFIDDDEIPSPHWLEHLLAAWEKYDHPAGVAGKVIPRYETEPTPWISDGAFFVRRSLPTGTSVEAAGAGNLLLDLAQVHALRLAFDVGLGTRGGEDTLFTRQLTARGGRLIWCEEATATDIIPAQRLTKEWVLRRAYAHGTVTAMVDLNLSVGSRARALTRVRLVAAGALRVVGGVARSVAGVITSDGFRRARGPWMVRRGLGMAAGAAGHGFDEYAREAGRND